MSIPNRQIGWSNESNLLWGIAKQLDELKGVMASGSCCAPSYKVYTALLTQSGTNAPVATVLENTLGGDIVWARVNTGSYTGTLINAFPIDKTICTQFPAIAYENNGTAIPIISGVTQVGWISAYIGFPDFIGIDTLNMIENEEWSSILGSSFLIEIRVYN